MQSELQEFIESNHFDPNIHSSGGEPLAIILAKNKQEDLLRQIITQVNFDPAIADEDGQSLVMWAIKMRLTSVVKILVADARIDLNRQSGKEGWTALLLAARFMPSFVQPLLKAGADPTAETKDGRSLIDLSIEARSILGLALSLASLPGPTHIQQQPSTSDLESISSEEKEDGGNHKWRSAKSYLMQLSQREQANFAFLYSQLDHTSTIEELIELLRFAKSNKVSAHLPLLFFINESKVMRCLPEQDDQAYFARVVKELGIKLVEN